ncbi:MAG TPA: MGMT family protein [Polyangiaceae bacterium]|nr:MGMT family protein [Polyangiaceae bacterium]
MAASKADERARSVYELVAAIPPGHVATYGQLADLAGIQSGHRVVARLMRDCPNRLPWHRVVGKHDARRARVALGDGEHALLQRTLLEREGVRFDSRGLVSLVEHAWRPG